GAFRFLEANNVRPSDRQPGEKTFLSSPERIDIPGNNFHHCPARREFDGLKPSSHAKPNQIHKSISTPGVGTITSLSGNAAMSCARVHSTAGTSPWTSTIFFGASFFV